mmetsp:Transcript_18932/g.13739  ORF Transcript_18932/g.13739 Transcript_18932/m.13739 type:complete len:100 (-) Transcript_18932:431-730(-)
MGVIFAVGASDFKVRLYDSVKKTTIGAIKDSFTMASHSNRVSCVKFHPTDANLLITGGWDNNLLINDLRTHEPVICIIGPHICGETIDIRSQDGIICTG